MSLKLYYDLLSQPSRALYIFFKKASIPFESKPVRIAKGEHQQPEYQDINPFNKLPAIEYNGSPMIESIAIVRYICREYKVADHWYPKDSKAQAKVDEYLEWQHHNTRLFCAKYFLTTFLAPILKGRPPKPERVAEDERQMVDCLSQIENIWLKDKPFLAGDQISVADLFAACEIEQPKLGGFDARVGRPKLAAWLDRVERATAPYYEEAHRPLNEMTSKQRLQRSNL